MTDAEIKDWIRKAIDRHERNFHRNDNSKKPPCSQEDVINYCKEKGYVIDIDDFWDYWEQREWKYTQGKNRIKLRVWKSYVNKAMKNGWHGCKKLENETPDSFLEQYGKLIGKEK